MDKINTDSIKPTTLPVIDSGSGISSQIAKPILDGNALHVGNGVPKSEGAGANATPEISEPAKVSIFEISEEQSRMFADLLMKLLQLSGIMLETQAQNLKNRQSANENVYSTQLKAAEETLSKNRTNAWVGIAAGGMTLAAAGFSVKQLGAAGSKTQEFSKLSGATKAENGVSVLSDASKNTMKGLGREIDQLNTKAQTITAGANAMGNTSNSAGQMAASQSEYEAAANEALANLQRKGAETLDQAVSSNQSVFDKLSSEMVASLKSVMMAAVR